MLLERGALDVAAKDALTAVARFRNRLVHVYWPVENERLYKFLQCSLGDLEQLGQSVAGHAW